MRRAEHTQRLEELLVRRRAALVVVEVLQGAEGLHEALPAVRLAVEAACHEVRAAVLAEEAARAHVDARRARDLGVAVLEQPVTRRVRHAPVAVEGDPVELDQPVLEARWERSLTRAHLLRRRVEPDHGLGARAARGRADAQDVEQRLVAARAVEAGGERALLRERERRQLDELRDLQRPIEALARAVDGSYSSAPIPRVPT